MKFKVILATNNPHKKEKLAWILDGTPFEIDNVDLHELDSIDEKGSTLLEIAENKALQLSTKYSSHLIISTDGGMKIPKLKEWDETKTKRFAGANISDFQRMDRLLEKAKKLSDRRMFWQEAVAIVKSGKVLFSFQTIGAEGLLQQSYIEKQYQQGIWLCSLWYFPQFNKNFFELNNEEREYAEISWIKLRNETRKFLLRYKNSQIN